MANPRIDVEAFFASHRVLPVIVIDDAAAAQPLAGALTRGGIPCAEVTLRTQAGIEAIRLMAQDPDMLVGAGTVLNADQARTAVDAGARFLVSPGYDEGVIGVGIDAGVPVVPGIATATEAQRAVNDGVRVVKFFPAVTSGGLDAVKALSAPFGGLRFVPTGGITLETARQWIDLSAVLAVGGTWVAPKELLDRGRFDEIEAITRRTVSHLNLLEGQGIW